jgi:hypothetical protein
MMKQMRFETSFAAAVVNCPYIRYGLGKSSYGFKRDKIALYFKGSAFETTKKPVL